MESSNYLGTEKIGKLLRKFCIPCIASLIISCLYNIVDQIFVGNGIGYLGNAATGVIFPITVIGWGMSLFFGDGAAAYLSVSLGKNETKEVHRRIGNSILFSFLSGVAIILVGYLWGDGLLRLIGATDATIALAHDYGYFLQSIGRAQAAAPLAILRDLLLIVFSIIVPVFFGVTGIFWAASIADGIAMLITAAVMLGLWKELQGRGALAEEVAGDTLAAGASAARPTRPGVIVTINREHGSAGKRIGQMLAEMLQVPCYYKEVTALAAQESGLAAEFISDINRNSPDLLKELYMSTDIVQQAVVAQDKIIKRIADSGFCIIVGRAADYMLRDHQDVVSIFIHAPKDYRMKKVMEMYGDTEAQAKKNIEHSDTARANYYKSVAGRPWANLDNYDLTIDSSMGEQACAEVILDFLKRKGCV